MAIPTVRTEIKRVLIIALWVVFCAGYFNRFPLPGFVSKVYLLLLSGLVAGAAWGWGSRLVRGRLRDQLTLPESIVLSTAAGFGVLALLMAAMGACGLWTRPFATGLVALGLLLGWGDYKNLASAPPKTTVTPIPSGVPLFLISTGILLGILLAFAPATYYDTLVYHYALPQVYLQAKHWVGQQSLIYSAFPQMMEMLWTLGMLLSGDVMANLLGWWVSLLGLAAVYTFGRRFFEGQTAAWAAALLSVMPAYLLLSSGGYIDVGLALYSFLSFYILCLPERSASRLALAGFFAGCAVGTKYTGAIPLGIGMLILLKETRPWTWKTVLAAESLYTGTALLTLSPWLVKNLHYFGNPVFPFFYRWNINDSSPWLDGAAGYFRGLTEYTPRAGWGLLTLIWDICVNGLNLGGGMDVLGDLGWAPLFVFLPALWWIPKKSPMAQKILLYALCFFIPWGMSRPVLRFLMPLTPFLALAAAYAYDQGLCRQPANIRWAGHLVLVLLCLSGFHVFLDVADTLSLFKVPLGFQARSQYLAKELNYYPAAAIVNTLPENSLTYVVGDQRGYYYNRPVLVTPVFNTNPLTHWANDASTGEELAQRLKAQGITHLLINRTELQRLDSVYHLFPFTPRGESNWNALRTRKVKSLYHDAHCDVLEIVS